jgi:alanyl-tRNA synthetase
MTPRTGTEIRRAFLEFFRERGHTVVPSASLIPTDPTLLLTVAGMVPFKPYLLGEEPTPYPRAASVQKCIRTVDIEVVGTTARHMSFFEMLGNFSFGDYFKEKAIPWAYELVTEGLGFDPDRLWFTVHRTDDEAAAIWIDEVGVSPDRLQRRDRDNFWQMGVAGPAGPSSEIFVDRGPEYGPDGGPVVDEERFTEIWNLVFMQYVQDRPYNVVGDLPAKSIDTGAGLERVAVQLQGVSNVFETDLVRPVLAAGESATGRRYGDDGRADVGLRILADHGRAVTFMIGDGVVPANEGRGYVLRRLLRRAVRHAWQLGAEGTVMPGLIDATIGIMGDAYPALPAARDGIVEMAEREERRFRRTLESGSTLLEEALDRVGEGSALPGTVAFKLHDTYGFPVELTEEIAAERGIDLDRGGFEAEMEAQRARARAAWRGGPDAEAAPAYRSLIDRSGPTEFVGYDTLETTGAILALVRDGEMVEGAGEGDRVEVFVDRTPFYAEAGGQVGDSGTIVTETGTMRVEDTVFPVQGLNGHRAVVLSGTVRVGQDATLDVDADRRERIRKSHTGTHVLHWALRDVLGTHVQQAGSLVEAGRLRFDFSHYAALDPEELTDVERETNERIIENARVRTKVMTRQEAEEAGALAFFGDKYGDRVRVVEAGSFSRELCGGTHVPATGQVGPLVLLGESSIGSNMRRVEAYTGATAYRYISDLRAQMRDAAHHLRARPETLGEAAAALAARSREQEARIEAFEAQARAGAAGSLVEQAEAVGTARLVVAVVEAGTTPDDLRALTLQVRDRLGSGLVVLGAQRDGKAALVAAASKDLVEAGVSAAAIAAGAARVVGGGGSRDPELAQAGGPRGEELSEALETARRLGREALKGR